MVVGVAACAIMPEATEVLVAEVQLLATTVRGVLALQVKETVVVQDLQ